MNLLEYKKFYKNIGSIPCPYFNNERVVFNRKGFNHFFWAGKSKRSLEILDKRLGLLFQCEFILKNYSHPVEYRIMRTGDSVAHFWGFTASTHVGEVKLVVRQINSGQKHFFSIFPLKH